MTEPGKRADQRRSDLSAARTMSGVLVPVLLRPHNKRNWESPASDFKQQQSYHHAMAPKERTPHLRTIPPWSSAEAMAVLQPSGVVSRIVKADQFAAIIDDMHNKCHER